MPMPDVAAAQQQMKAMLGQVAVEPAECKEAAMAGASASIEGATMAIGASQDAAAGTVTVVTLTSGISRSVLEQNLAKAEQQVANCGKGKPHPAPVPSSTKPSQ